MSMYYNPQIVRMLTNERLEEAVRAGLGSRTRSDEQAKVNEHDKAPMAERCIGNSQSSPANC